MTCFIYAPEEKKKQTENMGKTETSNITTETAEADREEYFIGGSWESLMMSFGPR